MQKNVLITGSLGYIGSVLSNYLSNKGHSCKGVDIGFFKDCSLYDYKATNTIFKSADQINTTDIEGIDCVVHLAGISNDPIGRLSAENIYNPTRSYAIKIAKLCKQLGVRFIFASSCSVYGVSGSEEVDESSDVNPQTFYSINKYQIEEDLKKLSGDNFSPIALRFATVFGLSPRIRFDIVINMFVGMALSDKQIVLNSDGQAWRPNLHILDACEAINQSIISSYSKPDLLCLNIGSEQNNRRIIDIAQCVADRVEDCKLRFLHEEPELDNEGLIKDRKVKGGVDTRTYKVSFKKMSTTFKDFECSRTIEAGVEEMLHELSAIPLTHQIFKQIKFYRLQYLEDLYEKNMIDDKLHWI